MEGENGAFTDEGGVLIERKGSGDFRGAGVKVGVHEQVAPLACGEVNGIGEVVAVDGGDEEILSEEVVVGACGGLHEWGGAVVGVDDIAVEIGDEFRMEPGEFADDFEFFGDLSQRRLSP